MSVIPDNCDLRFKRPTFSSVSKALKNSCVMPHCNVPSFCVNFYNQLSVILSELSVNGSA